MQWYYSLNNQQQGPVSEEQLRDLIAQGIISHQTLVWREGMPDWAPYQTVAAASPSSAGAPAVSTASGGQVTCPNCGSFTSADQLIPVGGDKIVCPNCRNQYSQRLKEGGYEISSERPEGTGGATPCYELRAHARQALSGQWGGVIGFVLVYWVCTFIVNLVSGLVPFLGAFIPFIISGPFTLGLMTNMLQVSRGGESDFNHIFSGFQDFGRAFGVYALTALIVSVPILLFGVIGAMTLMGMGVVSESSDPSPIMITAIVIVGLLFFAVLAYLSLRFSLVYFLLVDNPHMGVVDVVKTSWVMMDGQVLKLVWLYLTFIGWMLLCILTLGFGFLALGPYIMVSFARFYDDI